MARTGEDVRSRNYDLVASFYEALANLYSFGLISRAKRAELAYLSPGDRVLYLGVGSGEDAVAAAAKGARVTAIDLSARMVERLRRRLSRRRLSAELVTGDAMLHRPDAPYDAVCGNYFFNVFGADDMPVVLERMVRHVRLGGLLMIADMAPPEGPLAPLAWLYLRLGLSFFWLLGLASQHPIYSYRDEAAALGLREVAIVDHKLFGRGPALYRTSIFVRPEAAA